MVMQFRPARVEPGRRHPFYNPARDIAYLGVPLCRRAVLALDQQWRETWFQQFLQDNGCSAQDLEDGVAKLAAALSRILEADTDVLDALRDTGFSALPAAVQIALYTKIGQVFLGAVWAGVRDSRSPEDAPPPEIEELADAAGAALRPADQPKGGDDVTDTGEIQKLDPSG